MVEEFNIIKEGLKKEGIVYIDMLKDELTFQKHRASDKLYKGFRDRVITRGDSIVLQIANSTPYMWLVNDGKESGIRASYQAISAWALQKQDKGYITFANEFALNNFIQKVKHNLEEQYFTKDGDRTVPPFGYKRYFFIDIVIDRIKKTKLKKIEDDINRQLVKSLGLDKKEKVVKLNIA